MIDLTREITNALASPEARTTLLEIVRTAVREEMTAPPDALLDVSAAAKLMSMTPAAIRKAAERGKVPFQRMGRSLRFRRADLLAMAEAAGK